MYVHHAGKCHRQKILKLVAAVRLELGVFSSKGLRGISRDEPSRILGRVETGGFFLIHLVGSKGERQSRTEYRGTRDPFC
jgi:hypothetical protein